MTSDKGIPIHNIYYMLAYAFQALRQRQYEEVAAEEFDGAADLFAAILARGIARQPKQGLYREYVQKQDVLSVLRGRPDMPGCIRQQIARRRTLACEYDELSENNAFNRILKTAAVLLLREKSVNIARKQALKRVLLYFGVIDTIDPAAIRWNALRLTRANRSYEMLLNICRLLLDGMLQTTEDGRYKIVALSDEHMERLYEKFILEYYRRHHPRLHARPSQVKWDLPGDADPAAVRFLPAMQTDITLRSAGRTLIIDAKYYAGAMQTDYGRQSVHSANLYQIFTYVKNQQAAQDGPVSGMLLYARTREAVLPDFKTDIAGNSIAVRTLDLNRPFTQIAAQLDAIAQSYFPA